MPFMTIINGNYTQCQAFVYGVGKAKSVHSICLKIKCKHKQINPYKLPMIKLEQWCVISNGCYINALG